MKRSPFRGLSLLPLLSCLAAAPARADAPADLLSLIAPPGAGQQGLAVRVTAQGVMAKVCAGGPCSAHDGTSMEVGPDVKPLLLRGRVTEVALADGKRLVRVDVPGAQEPARWVMLLAAPLAGKGSEPLVLWSGWTGMAKGEHGEGRSMVVVEEPLAKGKRVVIGELREDVSICGRPTVVSASEVDPSSLELAKRASVQNLKPDERARAVKLTATRLGAARADTGVRLLKATAASSAVDKRFATLTDGDLSTTWIENKSGDGRGEFVSMLSASEVGVTSVDIAIAKESDGASPRTLFLASSDRLFQVTLPDDADRKAGGVYEVKLPEEVKSSCLSVVLEDAYASRVDKNPRVAIAEVSARSALSDLLPDALVAALAGGGDRAKAAAALLARGGPLATKAAAAGYSKLDEEGKRLAVGVVDSAPCSEQLPFFAGVVAETTKGGAASAPGSASRPVDPDVEPELGHALDRIRRCGRSAAPVLKELLGSASDRTRVLAANEIALVAPGEAVPVLLDSLEKASVAVRRELRKALAAAARSDRAKASLSEELSAERFKARPLVARVDLLRAAAARLGVVEGGPAAFGSVATPGADFRTRYLLLAPAAELARAGDAGAAAFLKAALREDKDPHIRARAAEVAGVLPSFSEELVAALSDSEPRVREGAIVGLRRAIEAGAVARPSMGTALAGRLSADPWTFVRSGAASALGALPAGAAADGALAGALLDLSPEVRGLAIDSLGAHKARQFIQPVRERFEDKEESLEVRARAILALASMCDKGSVDDWTTLARRSVRPLDERDRRLGSAAIAALGVVHPKDLQSRLAPLLASDAPPAVREIARAALAAKGECDVNEAIAQGRGPVAGL